MAKSFPNLVNDINLQIQEAQQTPSRINSKRNTTWAHHSQTTESYKERKILKAILLYIGEQ